MLNYSAADVLPPNVTASNYSRLPVNSVWWKPLPNNSAAVVFYASVSQQPKWRLETIAFICTELAKH